MALIDISRSIGPTTATWPGDQPVEWSWTARKEKGSSVNLGSLQLSMHTGAHADAPQHIDSSGDTIDELSLTPFLGPADVVEVHDQEVRPEHLPENPASRVLFRTGCAVLDEGAWPDDVTAISVPTIRALAEQEVSLVGTDAPSVDPLDSKELSAHHALIDEGIVNLEGLRLSDVRPGRYILVALPLKIEGGDAAPVRAALSTRSIALE